ncbi:hypothetical protein KY495_00760 [Massilia sp. PAMC28688]|uniref:hypothetical protein n=1 Tax=Massilia sp. PAMC28688 TaxID=2861283 RepID=UPI001C630FD9|nr:hypothetical protein [Massilia sp. PAMC28688]QYF93805.1 hypothetical protein KY495_00760 [Massilia sp. PAMC28688]
MNSEPSGLATAVQIEALADQLTLAADELHARVMKSIKAHKDGAISEAEQAVARLLLEDELVLRQRANGLLADAASYVVASLGQSQQAVMQLTADAAEKIRKIERLRDITGLVGGLLMLAGAAATGKVPAIITAIERVSKHVQRVKASTPAKD